MNVLSAMMAIYKPVIYYTENYLPFKLFCNFLQENIKLFEEKKTR